ncbi:MAG: hypothetical protein NT040_14805 [Bacteroidetes bacterium]|nr:hypothetical protein [Bacteroidota bacterium]
MKLTLAVLCLLPLFLACKSPHFTPKTYKKNQIIIGSSGGVTGMMKEYVLLDNGQLFLSKGLSGEWRELKSLKKSQTRAIFNKAEELDLGTLKFKHPGNLSYYLILKQPPRSNEVKWGETGVSPPEGITLFYEYLITLF